ncbi:MAG: TetR family transcriptional regulator, partial [Xanthomonadales bacterium]|nr:TetR family transcriptional regulator [Xanthomonadales bacterium]
MSAPASTQPRKIEIREANLALILEAAEKIFAMNGFRGAATGDIAREAGIPKANVHYYFKTKEDLYREVLRHILDDWMSAASTFEAHDDPAEALRTYVSAKMEFSRKRPYGSRVWAREIMSGAPVL